MFSGQVSGYGSARDETVHDDDYGDHKENVNQATTNVYHEETQQPQHEENYRDSPQHVQVLNKGLRGLSKRRARPRRSENVSAAQHSLRQLSYRRALQKIHPFSLAGPAFGLNPLRIVHLMNRLPAQENSCGAHIVPHIY